MAKPAAPNELVIHKPQPPAQISLVGVNVGALIDKAIDAKSAVEVIKELREMWKQDMALVAEKAFNDAMSAFQFECPVITKDKGVPTTAGKIAYKYAPIEVIEIVIRPFERAHGFHHTFDTDTSAPDGWVIQKCIITHVAGHSRISTGKFRTGTKTQMMSDTQVDASAQTFANRRALANAYGLILAGEDVDGQIGKPKPAGPSTLAGDSGVRQYVKELWEVLKTVRGDLPNWGQAKQWLVDECIMTPEEHGGDLHAPVLPPERFKEIIAKAKGKLK